jgi:hypothetical protein
VDANTVASTHASRKASSTHQAAELDDEGSQSEEFEDIQSELDEEFKEGTQQKYISPIEVRDHISRLWRKEGDLLNLIFGKFEPISPGAKFEV